MFDVPSAALRLRDALYRNQDNVLGLDLAHERVEIDESKPCTVLIRTDLPTAPGIPLLDVAADEWQIMVERNGVKLLSNQAFGYLAVTRVWRRVGTLGPPARLLRTDRFTKNLIRYAGLAPQEFVDLAWCVSEFESFGVVATPWRDSRPQPAGIRFASARVPEAIDLPISAPWMGGHCLPLGIFATAATFDSGWMVSPSLGMHDVAIVTVPRAVDGSTQDLQDQDLSQALPHPVLEDLGLPVLSQRLLKRSVRYQVDWGFAGMHSRFDDDDGTLRLLEEEINRLDTTGKPGDPSLVNFFLRLGLE